MTTATETLEEVEELVLTELDERVSDGLTVTLLWDRETNDLYVRVTDAKSGGETTYRRVEDPSKALEAFKHPFGRQELRLDRPVRVV